MATVETKKLLEVAVRIREMREIFGFTQEEMAKKTEVSVEMYRDRQTGFSVYLYSQVLSCIWYRYF